MGGMQSCRVGGLGGGGGEKEGKRTPHPPLPPRALSRGARPEKPGPAFPRPGERRVEDEPEGKGSGQRAGSHHLYRGPGSMGCRGGGDMSMLSGFTLVSRLSLTAVRGHSKTSPRAPAGPETCPPPSKAPNPRHPSLPIPPRALSKGGKEEGGCGEGPGRRGGQDRCV